MHPMIIATTYSSYSLVETKYKTAIEGIVAEIYQTMSLHDDYMFNIKYNTLLHYMLHTHYGTVTKSYIQTYNNCRRLQSNNNNNDNNNNNNNNNNGNI